MPATPPVTHLLTLCVIAHVLPIGQSTGPVQNSYPYPNPNPKPATPDPHGGVQMGKPKKDCDNAKDDIEIDWDPTSTEEFTCTEPMRPKGTVNKRLYTCADKADRPLHKCYPEAITYTDPLPTSGPHRPLWPKYGEYTYLPVQRWLHSLEHGGVAFLYHPCADSGEIAKLRAVATGCLRRHVISPSKVIPEGYNFALLSWTCKMLLRVANVTEMVSFVKTHALHGPEAVYSDGQYDTALVSPAKVVSTYTDATLCPGSGILEATANKVKVDSKLRRDSGLVADNLLADALDRFKKAYRVSQ